MKNRVNSGNLSLDPETKMRKALRRRTPDEWRSIIQALPSHVRTKIAKLVWWDYFGDRTVTDRWHHLDDYLYQKCCESCTLDQIHYHLTSIGFPETFAAYRIGKIGITEYEQARIQQKEEWRKKVHEKC